MSRHSNHAHGGANTGKPQVKWLLLVAVVLMLGAMALYTMTMDEAVVPGQPENQSMPAAP